MKKRFLIGLLILLGLKVKAQYYYLDILGTKQTNQQYKLLRGNEYKRVNAISFDAAQQPAKDFLLEQVISKDGSQIITHSASIGNAESYFIGIYKDNRIVKTVDSNTNAINTVIYNYDNTGKLISTVATNKDFDGTFTSSETHNWSYNEKGLPEKMLKIKNATDTTIVSFTIDEQDNVAEEKWLRNKRTTETYYYYYNPKKQLTDVVRYSIKAKRMLPDYIFEYDNRGRVTQMTQTQNGTANYLVWNYTYNESGMKAKETVYNKQKELLGTIEYRYQ